MSARNAMPDGRDCVPADRLPGWVPEAVRLYLSHTAHGRSLRALARDHGCHASTVLRQVRRFENRRDDPLVDDALRKLDRVLRSPPQADGARAASPLREPHAPADVVRAGRDCLAHLAQDNTLLIVAPDMPKAVITREDGSGVPQRVAIVDRCVAEAMALKDWITCRSQGRVLSYVISPAGRAELRGADAALVTILPEEPGAEGEGRRIRYGAAESPVSVLARRRDKSGAPFLTNDLVQAAARLREDFVMAQLDALAICPAQEVLAALEARAVPGPNIASPGTRAARQRIRAVLQDLGPGLGDMVLRCCCWLEGVESAETALGWSARSGKIVLRIGLQRLSRHYRGLDEADLMIG